MIPAFLIPIPAFPLNLSGKIDRTRLPMPTPDQAPVDARPLDELEPVSYTHLDVYKRQNLAFKSRRWRDGVARDGVQERKIYRTRNLRMTC